MKATLGDPTWWPARAMKRSASAIIIKNWPPELEVDAEQLPKVAAFLQPAVRRALRRRLGQTPNDGADRRGAQRAVDTQLGQPGPAQLVQRPQADLLDADAAGADQAQRVDVDRLHVW